MKEIFITEHPIQSLLAWGGGTAYCGMAAFNLYPPLLTSVVTVSGGVLIAGIAANLAFQNMNKNEVRKKSREQYYSYCRYMNGVQNRCQWLSNIRLYLEPVMASKMFTRGVVIPFIPIKPFYDDIDFSELSFLGAELARVENEGGADGIDYSCLNMADVQFLEVQLRELEGAIEYRNEIHTEKILPLITKNYLGGGDFSVSLSDFVGSLSYYEFSEFLKTSEDILMSADSLLRELSSILENLNKLGKSVLDWNVVEESGGTPRHSFKGGGGWGNLDVKCEKLEGKQMELLYGSDYPRLTPDYSQGRNW